MLYLLQYMFFPMKNRAQRAQEQNRAWASPSGTACLIGESSTNLAPYKRSPASSRFPWSTKTSQMGVSYPATPKIYKFPPQIPPNEPNSERTHPTATSGIVYIYLLVPPTPPHPLHYPALLSGTLGILTNPTCHPRKDPITNPNQPWHNSNSLFF